MEYGLNGGPLTVPTGLLPGLNGVLRSRVSSPVVVGRHEELGRILGNLRTDSADHHPLIVVGGEAGVGKTRFVEEAFSRVSESGYRVLSGGCINLGDAYPYAPFVEALRDLTRQIERSTTGDSRRPTS